MDREVQALRAGRRDDVRGVAGEEQAPVAASARRRSCACPVTPFSRTGPSSSVQPSSARPRLQLLPDAVVRPLGDVLVRRGTGCRGACASGERRLSSAKPRGCACRRARPIDGGDVREDPEPAERVLALERPQDLSGSPGRQTPWNPSQPAITSQSSRCSLAVVRVRTYGRVAVEVVHRDVVHLEQERQPVVEPRGDQILDHLGLPVDDDRRAAGQLAHRDVVALAVELEIDAVVDDPLAVQPLADSRAASSRSTVPCSSTPARMRVSTYSRLRSSSTTDSIPARCEQPREGQPRRAGADDADLGARAASRPSSASTCWAIANARLAAGHAAVDRGLEQHLLDLVRRQAVPQRRAHVHRELVVVVERDERRRA